MRAASGLSQPPGAHSIWKKSNPLDTGKESVFKYEKPSCAWSGCYFEISHPIQPQIPSINQLQLLCAQWALALPLIVALVATLLRAGPESLCCPG